MMLRDQLLARTLVELADTLVDDFDVVDLLTLLTDRCVEVLDVAAAGLMLGHPDGQLRVMASSSEATRLLELFELQTSEGPCPDCCRSGEAIVNRPLHASGGPWPQFGAKAVAAGFRSVHALPMRLREESIGALNLFCADEGALSDDDVLAAQALADVATIAVLQHRQTNDAQLVNQQLHGALNSRIVIEQAKGMVAERSSISVDEAFDRLRHHARTRNRRLVDVADDVIAGRVPPRSLDPAPRSPVRVATGPAARVDAPAAATPILRVLDRLDAAAPVDAVEVVTGQLAATLGIEEVSFLIADLGGSSIVRVPGAGRGAPSNELEVVATSGTDYERALVSQEVQVVAAGGGYRIIVPVTERGDALGVLTFVAQARPDDALLRAVASAAQELAYVVIASGRHTDLFERVQRSTGPFSLAAEIQRRVLPPAFTCQARQFTFAGWLEPARHVGGDTFDYSVEREVLHVSMTDAMGRGVAAALLATLALGSLRNSRLSGVGLAGQAGLVNEAMLAHAADDQFVTGILLRVELASGRVAAVNAGHPRPFLLRDGRVECLALSADIPFGIEEGCVYHEQELQLEPGDRLVIVTDGLLERKAALTDFDVGTTLEETAALHPREVVHAFKGAMLATGTELADDAAVLCIDWHGPATPSGK